MNRRCRATLLGVAGLALSHSQNASACPCEGSSGPASSVTSPDERFGASVIETARVAHGSFSYDGVYRSLGAESHESTLDVTVIAGYRPLVPVELSAETAAGHGTVAGPGSSSVRTGLGDTTLRARWDAVPEPPPFQLHAVPWPAVSLVASLRTPTATGAGSGSAGTTGSIGSSASSEGMGAWETASGAVLTRRLGTKWQITGFFEAAYRFPDTTLGLARHLPPRLFGQIGARYSPTLTTAVGALTDLGWEGDITIRGKREQSTSQQLWSVAAFGTFRTSANGLRWGALVRWVPPANGISRNATATTSVSVSLGYAL